LNPRWGVDNHNTPLRIAMMKKDTKMVTLILKSLDKDDKKNADLSFANLPAANINRIETGFNDKYAYGVKTRTVQMSRGNKQGNNAFTFDNFNQGSSGIPYGEADWMMSNNDISLDEIKQIISYNPDMRHIFLRTINAAILAGNNVKAEYFISENLKNDEYTFNKFHRLALIAKSPKGLTGI
jgi:hypothetical protein